MCLCCAYEIGRMFLKIFSCKNIDFRFPSSSKKKKKKTYQSFEWEFFPKASPFRWNIRNNTRKVRSMDLLVGLRYRTDSAATTASRSGSDLTFLIHCDLSPFTVFSEDVTYYRFRFHIQFLHFVFIPLGELLYECELEARCLWKLCRKWIDHWVDNCTEMIHFVAYTTFLDLLFKHLVNVSLKFDDVFGVF